MPQASILPESGHIQPDLSALCRARDCTAGTFPHNQLSARAKREVKQLAWWFRNSLNRYIVIRYRVTDPESRISFYESLVRHQSSINKLIRRGKFRAHAERRLQYASRHNCLNAFFLFKGALLVMVREPPAWFNTKEWSAVRPQCQVRHTH